MPESFIIHQFICILNELESKFLSSPVSYRTFVISVSLESLWSFSEKACLRFPLPIEPRLPICALSMALQLDFSQLTRGLSRESIAYFIVILRARETPTLVLVTCIRLDATRHTVNELRVISRRIRCSLTTTTSLTYLPIPRFVSCYIRSQHPH